MFNSESDDLAFGDIVRILTNAETEHLKLEGQTGEILGISDPRTSGVDVVGDFEDVVFAVTFDDNSTYWVRPELIEKVERPPVEMTVGNLTVKRDRHGNWTESRKPWWKFWS